MQKAYTGLPEPQLAAFVTQHRMLTGVRRLGLAVSGGSDSVALLRLLAPLCRAAGVTPVALHFDHGLRGAASAADARFAARLARRLGVECRVESGARRQAPVAGRENANRGLSLEMVAREMRQAFFREAARDEHLDAIATGHTADDVAETLLLRLARGSGAAGLSGLRPCHTVAGVKYVRPLLGCTHEELRAWLRRKRQGWREDASNCNERIPRNRLRHTVLPWLERHGSPSIRAMLAQSASILRDEDALLDEMARIELSRLSSPSSVRSSDCFSSTLHFPPSTLPRALQRRVVRLWLLDAGCASAAGWDEVEGILARRDKKAAWQMSLPGGLLVREKDDRLELVEPSAGSSRLEGRAPASPSELNVPGSVDVAGVQVTARRMKGIVRTPGPVGALPSSCSLDAGALRGKTLLVRTRRPGDRIRPLGLDGSKTLQDLLVDAKVPSEMRGRLPLLVVDDEVVWVPGYRVARAYAVRGPRAAAVRVRMGG
jgi:tRNA(Ile)-lysidine synthase